MFSVELKIKHLQTKTNNYKTNVFVPDFTCNSFDNAFELRVKLKLFETSDCFIE